MRPSTIEIADNEPRLTVDGLAVAAVVHACHERTIDVALAELAVPGLDRASLEPVLTYCAELACEADDATCPGCKRRTESKGIHSLDDFIASHREIVVGDGRVRLTGQGEATTTTPALEALAKTWSGENYWFWARRVLRKLRHGIRRAHIQGSAIADAGQTPAVILMEPQLPDNIGMVARAMANFGLDELRLVAPRDGWPQEKARIAASGANYVIDDAAAYPTLEAALGELREEYREVPAALAKKMQEVVEAGDEPGVVADVVLKAASAARPQLRYTAGGVASRLRLLRRFAPAAMVDAGIRKDLQLDALTASLPRTPVLEK